MMMLVFELYSIRTIGVVAVAIIRERLARVVRRDRAAKPAMLR
jgi:hypothetical protein